MKDHESHLKVTLRLAQQTKKGYRYEEQTRPSSGFPKLGKLSIHKNAFPGGPPSAIQITLEAV